MYALIGISLVLLGVAGLQFTYLFYIDRVYRERTKHLKLVEQKCSRLAEQLDLAERRMAEQERVLAAIRPANEDEIWADVIGDS